MPLAKAATQKAMSAAAGRSWYLVELRNRARDRFDNLTISDRTISEEKNFHYPPNRPFRSSGKNRSQCKVLKTENKDGLLPVGFEAFRPHRVAALAPIISWDRQRSTIPSFYLWRLSSQFDGQVVGSRLEGQRSRCA
jgi:hypothetical protein